MLGDDELNARESANDRSIRVTRTEGMLAPLRDPAAYEWGEETANTVQFDVRNYLRLIARHWLLVLSVFILALGAGVAQTMLTTKMYTAKGTVQIDREAARVGNLQTFEAKESVGNNADEFFQTQHAILRSRALAVATANDPDLNLTHDQAFLRGLGLVKAGQRPLTTEQAREAIVSYIQRSLDIAPVQRSRIVELSISSPDAAASAKLVNAIANNFIREALRRRRAASVYGAQFLEEELKRTEASLSESEKQLAQYARDRGIISVSVGGGGSGEGGPAGGSSSAANQTLDAASLAATRSALDSARAARFSAQQKWETAARAIGPNSRDVLSSNVIQQLKQDRARLQSEYNTKLVDYRPQAPEMKARSDAMAAIDQQILDETNAIRESLTTALKTDYDVAVGNENKLAADVRRLTSAVLDVRDGSIRYDILQREVDTKHQLYDNLLQQLKEITVSGNLQTNNISILDAALPPTAPSEPKPVRNLLIAAILGLMLGFGLAILFEFLDESIRTPDDVEGKLGLPLLGSIPKLEKGVTVSEALADIRSPFSEAYYSVRTALQFSTNEGVPSSLAVTSSRPSEGKSTSASTIARNFARLGSRVLLIDADLRNPSLHRLMNVDNAEGLSNYLTGGKSLRQLALATDTPNLHFIPCGPLPPNPAELLGGHKLDAMLKEAREYFDMVILDCPPVLGLADAPLLASAVAGTVLVVEAGGTGRHHAKATIRRLSVGNARILGILLTKFDARRSSYGYGYGYGYAYDYTYGDNQRAIGKK